MSTEEPWYTKFPAPKQNARSITRAQFLSWLGEGQIAGKDFMLVDLRRIDHEGGTISGSINLPAQSLYPSIPALYTLFSNAGIAKVVWFCNSSRGRGTRAAGWFADYIQSQNNQTMESCVLEGGIKGWATAGDEFVKLMDGPFAGCIAARVLSK